MKEDVQVLGSVPVSLRGSAHSFFGFLPIVSKARSFYTDLVTAQAGVFP